MSRLVEITWATDPSGPNCGARLASYQWVPSVLSTWYSNTSDAPVANTFAMWAFQFSTMSDG